MTTPNLIIVIMLVVGTILLSISWRMDKNSSFNNGSFLIQIILAIIGACLIIGSLFSKLVLSFVG